MTILLENKVNKVKQGLRVGIPRSLHFYKYFPFWESILTRMGCEIVLSPETNKEILELGSTFASSELCVPIKIYFGHILYFLKNQVDIDYLFIPRYVSIKRHQVFCPKFLALPDTIKNVIKPSIPILEVEFNIKEYPILKSIQDLGRSLGINSIKSKKIYFESNLEMIRFYNELEEEKLLPEIYFERYSNYGIKSPNKKRIKNKKHILKEKNNEKIVNSGYPIRIALLGHAYNTYETIINQDLLMKLKSYNVEIFTIENMPQKIFRKKIKIDEKFYNYWNNEEEILQTSSYLLENSDGNNIDGAIFLISFACGPDSLIQELVMRDFKDSKVPFLTLILDEHSGESGMITRIESFVDMIRRKKYQKML